MRKIRRQAGYPNPPLPYELEGLCLVAVTDTNLSHKIPDTVQLLKLGSPWTTAKYLIKYKDSSI